MPYGKEELLQPARIRELDGLRGVAITLVIALHVAIRPFLHAWTELLGKPIARLLDMSWCGVDIFFVLSGFLIGRIILDYSASRNFYSAFYARRAARILPLYVLIVTLAFLLQQHFNGSDDPGAVPLLAYVTFSANLFTSAGFSSTLILGPLWSICIEEQFYIVAPVAIRKCSKRVLPFAVVGVVVASAILRISCSIGWIKLGFSYWDFTLTRLDGLGLGVLTALLVRQTFFVEWVKTNGRLLKLMLISLICISVWFSQQPEALLLGGGIFFLSLTSAVAIVVLIFHPRCLFGRIMRLPFLVSLGKYSYFLYVFHMVFEFAARVGLEVANITNVAPSLALKLFFVILLYFVAMASFRYIESPITQRGRKVQY